MKISQRKLKRIIKEELTQALKEQLGSRADDAFAAMDRAQAAPKRRPAARPRRRPAAAPAPARRTSRRRAAPTPKRAGYTQHAGKKCPRTTQEAIPIALAGLKAAAGKKGLDQMDVMNDYCISDAKGDAKSRYRRTLVRFKKHGIAVLVNYQLRN